MVFVEKHPIDTGHTNRRSGTGGSQSGRDVAQVSKTAPAIQATTPTYQKSCFRLHFFVQWMR